MKLSKEEVRTPDKFGLALRTLFAEAVKYKVLVLGLFGSFIIGGAIWYGIDYSNSQTEAKLQEKYYLVERAYEAKKKDFEEAAADAIKKNADKSKKNEKAEPDAPKKAVASGDLENDYGKIVSDFNELVSQHPNSKAGMMSSIFLAEIYSNYKQTDKALAILEKVNTKNQAKDLLHALTLFLKASLLADSNQCDKAQTHFENILGSKKLTFMESETKLRLALCYDKMKNSEKAKQLLTELKQTPTEMSQGMPPMNTGSHEAEKYLRLLSVE